MLKKRIIPCLDIKDSRTVKGTNFLDLRDAGDPVELAIRYCEESADELVFLDITATNEKRKTLPELVNRIAKNINIPFTVGGGVKSIADVEMLLENGADKISVNSAAFNQPSLISELAKRFGSQCIVVAIDTRSNLVHLNGGRQATITRCTEWAKQVADLGAGEILLTSMDHDGTKNGFAVSITKTISESVSIPVIASGGAGTMNHFAEVFDNGKADAALAASVFHYREITIPKLKEYLCNRNINVRR
jgi:cyclase